MGFPIFLGNIPSVIFGHFLFDNIGFQVHSQMVGLTCKVCRKMVIHFFVIESWIAKVGPEDGGHSQFMGLLEGAGDLLDLVRTFLATEQRPPSVEAKALHQPYRSSRTTFSGSK